MLRLLVTGLALLVVGSIALAQESYSEHVGESCGLCGYFSCSASGCAGSVSDVPGDGEVREEGVVLVDDGEPASFGR